MTDELRAELDRSEGRKIFIEYLKTEFADNCEELIQKFDTLTSLYFEVNSVINISALRTVDDVFIKHYLDSIVPYKYLGNGTLCDVGCGGGFPSLPLAIATDLTVTGVESVGKKLLLIHRSISELHIKNLKADYARAEDLAKLHRTYDVVCARALADSDKALKFCAPLCKSGGTIVLYKTQNDTPAKPDTQAQCFVSPENTVDYTLYGTDINRRLFIYRKN